MTGLLRSSLATRLGPLAWGLAAPLFLACAAAPPGELPKGERLDETPPQQVLTSEYCQSRHPGDTPLRRLTHAEYRNTLEDLGLPRDEVEAATASFPPEPVSLGFRNGARTLNVDTLMAQEYARVAELFRSKLSPSCADGQTERQCAEAFVKSLGRRLYRRTLAGKEVDAVVALYEQASEGGESLSGAVAWTVEAMLQSPDFLYRVEIPEKKTAPVTGFEMASRLAYTFWQSPPDEKLLAAAEAGELETQEQVDAQVQRMLKDGRALRVYEFFQQWLGLDDLTTLDRDPELYPDLPGNLATLLRTENQAFVQSLLRRSGADLKELLTADYTYANDALAAHYGLSGPETALFEKVAAPGRSGVLTQGMLAVQDRSARTSIVRRGLKVRTDFLCDLVPAPPANVNPILEGIGENLTQAERLAQHREEVSCSGCHQLMDPIGTIFEGFDAVGRRRKTDEYGAPVPVGGELKFSLDLDGEYASVPELGQAMADSREVEQCYLIQNFRFFFGRDAKRDDLCSQAQLTEHFQQTGQSLSELYAGLARTDAFLFKAGLADLEASAASEGGN